MQTLSFTHIKPNLYDIVRAQCFLQGQRAPLSVVQCFHWMGVSAVAGTVCSLLS